jgi:hypothetical protein
VDDAEAEFWSALEYRITTELWGFEDQLLRSLWCDGLVPEEYDLRTDRPCIRGTAYCGQSGQDRWRFTLLLGDPDRLTDWSALLPGEELTGWLSVHPRERALIVDPSSAYAL